MAKAADFFGEDGVPADMRQRITAAMKNKKTRSSLEEAAAKAVNDAKVDHATTPTEQASANTLIDELVAWAERHGATIGADARDELEHIMSTETEGA